MVTRLLVPDLFYEKIDDNLERSPERLSIGEIEVGDMDKEAATSVFAQRQIIDELAEITAGVGRNLRPHRILLF